jgi:hypothetical protein
MQLLCFEYNSCQAPNPGKTDPINLGKKSWPLATALLLPPTKSPLPPNQIPLSIKKILEDCKEVWYQNVLKPLKELEVEFAYRSGSWSGNNVNFNCADADAKLNAYLAKRKQIYSDGVRMIKGQFIQKSKALDKWIMMNLYGTQDDLPKNHDNNTDALVGNLEYTIAKDALRNESYKAILGIIDQGRELVSHYRSYCEQNPQPDPDPGANDLRNHKVRRVDCVFKKIILTPVRYEFHLECSTMWEKTDPRLRKRQPDIQKGSVLNSNWEVGSSILNHLELQNGPGTSQIFYGWNEQHFIHPGPLTEEKKDPTLFSLQYDKWGNLVGCNFQLNEDKTELKDPKSNVSGVDSRWSWNAIASTKKGPLNKLITK